MKKTLSLLLVVVLFTLVGCTTPNNQLPELKESDKVDMTAEQKADFLRTVVELTADETSNFRLDTFLDLEFAMTSDMDMNFDGMTMESEQTITLDVDYDATNYVELGDTAEDTYLYSKFNSFELDFFSDIYASTQFGEESFVEDNTQTVQFSLTDTYFLSRSDYAYFYLNGSASIETKTGDQIVDTQTESKTFNNLKEKTLEGRISQEMYTQLMESILAVQESITFESDLDLTEEEKAEVLEAIDSYVNIYSSGTTHTVQLLITTQKVSELIDQLFDTLEAELTEMTDLSNLATLKTSIKAAFKSFNFDFRIILEGELDGVKKLSKVEMIISGEFSGFTLNAADFGETEIPMLIQLTVKLERFGFTLDFDADKLTLPTDSELETFTLVEEPSFTDIFSGIA